MVTEQKYAADEHQAPQEANVIGDLGENARPEPVTAQQGKHKGGFSQTLSAGEKVWTLTQRKSGVTIAKGVDRR